MSRWYAKSGYHFMNIEVECDQCDRQGFVECRPRCHAESQQADKCICGGQLYIPPMNDTEE